MKAPAVSTRYVPIAHGLLTLTLGIVTPLVALATVALTPFSDRLTQGLISLQYFALLWVVVAV